MNVLLGKAFSNASFEIESEASISVLFEVGKQGQFILRYVDSASETYREMMRDFFTGGLFTEVRTSGRETWTMSWGKETQQISDTWNLTRVMWLIPHHNSNCSQEL